MAVAGPMRIGPRTELGLQAALQGSPLVLIGAPHRGGGACVADRPRFVHGPEGERVVDASQEAGDLHDAAGWARSNRDVTHAATPDPPPTSDRGSSPRLNRFQRHVRSSLDGCGAYAVRRSAYAAVTQYLNDAFVPPPPPLSSSRVRTAAR